MVELENLLKNVTKEAPDVYCNQHGEDIRRYFQIKLNCFTSLDKTEEQVIKSIFTEYPDTKVLSSYSRVELNDNIYYGGILLIPKIPKKVKKQPLITSDIIL